MESLKSIARRARQTIREKVTSTEHSVADERLVETTKKVKSLEKSSEVICEKVLKAAKLMEELGMVMKEIGEEYRTVPDLVQESGQLAEDMFSVGTTLVQSAQEHQKGLKDHGFEVLNGFLKDIGKLRDAEETRRRNQLEYDFFYAKVMELRRSPPKDFSRIPRNEQILENWRVELWKSTENTKAVCSSLYVQGRRAIDLSSLTTVQVLGSFLNVASMGFKQQFVNARLPVYPTAPELPPAPLPPNPLPPFQQPQQVPPSGYVYGAPSMQPPQGGWQQPSQQQGQQPQWQPAQPPPQPAWGQSQMPTQPPPNWQGNSNGAPPGAVTQSSVQPASQWQQGPTPSSQQAQQWAPQAQPQQAWQGGWGPASGQPTAQGPIPAPTAPSGDVAAGALPAA